LNIKKLRKKKYDCNKTNVKKNHAVQNKIFSIFFNFVRVKLVNHEKGEILILLHRLLIYCDPVHFTPNLWKTEIGESGCAAYFFCVPDSFSYESMAEDSSKVYMADCEIQG